MKDERLRVSQAQERGVARRLGAVQHKGSGSGHRRFDMHTDEALIECKTVLQGNKQITLKASVLADLTYQAAVQDRVPVLHVELAGKRWVLHPEGDSCIGETS